MPSTTSHWRPSQLRICLRSSSSQTPWTPQVRQISFTRLGHRWWLTSRGWSTASSLKCQRCRMSTSSRRSRIESPPSSRRMRKRNCHRTSNFQRWSPSNRSLIHLFLDLCSWANRSWLRRPKRRRRFRHLRQLRMRISLGLSHKRCNRIRGPMKSR